MLVVLMELGLKVMLEVVLVLMGMARLEFKLGQLLEVLQLMLHGVGHGVLLPLRVRGHWGRGAVGHLLQLHLMMEGSQLGIAGPWELKGGHGVHGKDWGGSEGRKALRGRWRWCCKLGGGANWGAHAWSSAWWVWRL